MYGLNSDCSTGLLVRIGLLCSFQKGCKYRLIYWASTTFITLPASMLAPAIC